MKSANLIPATLRKRWEWQRQGIQWTMVWAVFGLILWIVSTIVETRLVAVRQQVDADRALLHEVSQATNQVQQLSLQSANAKRLVENAQLLELTDVPLALLQTLVECCQLQGRGIQMDSIRLYETRPSTSKEGAVAPALKQMLLSGLVDSDLRATSFVNSLQASGQFERVELLSIQGSDDQQVRSFSIRCEEKM
jgi:hypothetical protein